MPHPLHHRPQHATTANKLRDLFSIGGTVSVLRGLTDLNVMGNGFAAEDGTPLSRQAVRVMMATVAFGDLCETHKAKIPLFPQKIGKIFAIIWQLSYF